MLKILLLKLNEWNQDVKSLIWVVNKQLCPLIPSTFLHSSCPVNRLLGYLSCFCLLLWSSERHRKQQLEPLFWTDFWLTTNIQLNGSSENRGKQFQREQVRYYFLNERFPQRCSLEHSLLDMNPHIACQEFLATIWCFKINFLSTYDLFLQ